MATIAAAFSRIRLSSGRSVHFCLRGASGREDGTTAGIDEPGEGGVPGERASPAVRGAACAGLVACLPPAAFFERFLIVFRAMIPSIYLVWHVSCILSNM